MSTRKKNISLSSLDRYAKMLTTRQVHKLYESRAGFKYKALLLEEQNIGERYRVFASNDAISLSGLSSYEFRNFIEAGVPGEGYEKLPDVLFTMENHQGIWISCKYQYTFREILSRLAELEISEEVEDTVEPHEFAGYLYPAAE